MDLLQMIKEHTAIAMLTVVINGAAVHAYALGIALKMG